MARHKLRIRISGAIILGIIICSIGFIVFSNPMGLSKASIVSSSSDGFFKVYTPENTFSCGGRFDPPGADWYWPYKGTTCILKASGNDIILISNEGEAGWSGLCTQTVPQYCGIYKTCPLGAFDPYPDNNIIEAKCHELIEIGVELGQSYLYGDDVPVKGYLYINDKPFLGGTIKGKITKDNNIISEAVGYSDANGIANLLFEDVEGIGFNNISLSSTYAGVIKAANTTTYFGGEIIKFTSTTYSYIQYSPKVEFTVDIIDVKGKYIAPSMISNLSIISTITNSNILGNSYEYLGNGKYKIISNVTGSGQYSGKIKILYQGVEFDSNYIKIDVRDVAVEVDTSTINPVANLGETKTMKFSTTSSNGGTINPDSITIQVNYPDGFTTDTIDMSKIKKVSDGVYNFNYTFTQVEKYTFTVYADKLGYVRGSSTASVTVGSVEENISFVGLILGNMGIIVIIVILLTGTILYMQRKK